MFPTARCRCLKKNVYEILFNSGLQPHVQRDTCLSDQNKHQQSPAANDHPHSGSGFRWAANKSLILYNLKLKLLHQTATIVANVTLLSPSSLLTITSLLAVSCYCTRQFLSLPVPRPGQTTTKQELVRPRPLTINKSSVVVCSVCSLWVRSGTIHRLIQYEHWSSSWSVTVILTSYIYKHNAYIATPVAALKLYTQITRQKTMPCVVPHACAHCYTLRVLRNALIKSIGLHWSSKFFFK